MELASNSKLAFKLNVCTHMHSVDKFNAINAHVGFQNDAEGGRGT